MTSRSRRSGPLTTVQVLATAAKQSTSRQARMSVLADGTTVDQEYYQSKHYILSQLEERKGDKPS